ncbi:hypothetical protein LP43_1831 [Methylophaga thiooxydans]|uniref:Uncharacterized protein n=1 Tax=Methylophaga thiooxydans TaxID=392484 RepID=A0A0A0BG06_9GAMM|nr:hypothetical protein LP43_1831 [Methylophaga thiooxydans]
MLSRMNNLRIYYLLEKTIRIRPVCLKHAASISHLGVKKR